MLQRRPMSETHGTRYPRTSAVRSPQVDDSNDTRPFDRHWPGLSLAELAEKQGERTAAKETKMTTWRYWLGSPLPAAPAAKGPVSTGLSRLKFECVRYLLLEKLLLAPDGCQPATINVRNKKEPFVALLRIGNRQTGGARITEGYLTVNETSL